MAGSDIARATCWQSMPVVLMARMRNPAGNYITQASLASVVYSVYDFGSTTPDTVTATGTLTISSVVFDALQNDARWTIDTTGYNFLWLAPGSLFPSAPTEYRVKVMFTGTDGYAYPAVWQLQTRPLP